MTTGVRIARIAGHLLADIGAGSELAIDALAVATAIRLGGGIVATHDPDDLHRLAGRHTKVANAASRVESVATQIEEAKDCQPPTVRSPYRCARLSPSSCPAAADERAAHPAWSGVGQHEPALLRALGRRT